MKKQELILYTKHIAKMIQYDTGLELKTARVVTTSIIGIIGYNIIKNKSISLSGIGTFKLVKPPIKKTYDVATQQKVTYQPRNKVRFYPTRNLKNILNNTLPKQ